MQRTPSTANPAPASSYGQAVPCERVGTTRPAARLTASAVRPVRHHARYVRSLARRVRRVASPISSKARRPDGCWRCSGSDMAIASPLPHEPIRTYIRDMDRRVLRLGAIGAAMTALLMLAATTATASTSMAPSLRIRARALERARTLPHGFFSLTTVYLQTAPVAVVRNGVTYDMSLAVSADPGFGSSLDVSLGRVQADGLAFQAHDYSFSPQSGINFRYDKKGLETATLDTTTAIS